MSIKTIKRQIKYDITYYFDKKVWRGIDSDTEKDIFQSFSLIFMKIQFICVLAASQQSSSKPNRHKW